MSKDLCVPHGWWGLSDDMGSDNLCDAHRIHNTLHGTIPALCLFFGNGHTKRGGLVNASQDQAWAGRRHVWWEIPAAAGVPFTASQDERYIPPGGEEEGTNLVELEEFRREEPKETWWFSPQTIGTV